MLQIAAAWFSHGFRLIMFISNHVGEPAMCSVYERLCLAVTSASRGTIEVPGDRVGTGHAGSSSCVLGATSVFGENRFGVRWDEMPKFPGKT